MTPTEITLAIYHQREAARAYQLAREVRETFPEATGIFDHFAHYARKHAAAARELMGIEP